MRQLWHKGAMAPGMRPPSQRAKCNGFQGGVPGSSPLGRIRDVQMRLAKTHKQDSVLAPALDEFDQFDQIIR